MSFSLQRSPGGTHVRNSNNPDSTKNAPVDVYRMAGLVGFWPICGMGTFNSNAKPYSAGMSNLAPNLTTGQNITAGYGGPCIMDDIWPNVYKTLTETWSDPGGTKTVVTQYQDYIDVPCTQTTSGSCRGIYSISGSPTITSTVVTQAYCSLYGGVVDGTYTATLSGQWNAATNWGGVTSNAALTLVGAPYPAPGVPGSGYMVGYYPTTTGIKSTPSPYMDWTYACACANGMPVRINPFPPASFGTGMGYPAFPTIYEADEYYGVPANNQGGVIVVGSQWVITGSIGYYGFRDVNIHNIIYGQGFNPATFTMGSVSEPTTFYAANNATANPITYFTYYLSFTPHDVQNTLGAPYGILGFFNTPM